MLFHVVILIIWIVKENPDYDNLPLYSVILYLITVPISLVLVCHEAYLFILLNFSIKPIHDIERMEIEEMRRG